MDEPRSVAQRIAEAACAFEQQRTGIYPSDVTVVLSAETLVVTLHGALSPAEKALSKTPEGGAKVQEFHRVLFASSSEPLRQEIKRITGADVRQAEARQADAGVVSAAIVPVFAAGAIVQIFLLADKLPTETWSGKTSG
jgi:uncharacterized protein YbcI